MAQGKYPPEVREQAVMLAAGASVRNVAASLGVNRETLTRWVNDTDPATLEQYVAAKRAIAQRNVLEQTDAATRRIMEKLLDVPLESAKDLQAASTTLGIMDDHYGGRQNPNASTRFGTRDAFLDGWTEHDRVTLERIERVVLEPTLPQTEG